ncbi:MAG: DNA-directed DNA polymerase II small subunit [Thermoplasmatota archaeon]
MEDIASRLFKYQRLLSPDAHAALKEQPTLVDSLEVALKGGAELPTVIERRHIETMVHNGPGPSSGEEAKAETTMSHQGETSVKRSPAPRIEPISREINIKRNVEKTGGSGTVTIEHEPVRSFGIRKDIPGERREEFKGIAGSVSEIMRIKPNIERTPARRLAEHSRRPRPLAAEYDGEIRIIRDPMESVGSQGKVDDFRKLFLDRFRSLRDMLLKQYGALSPALDIGSLRGSEDTVRFVGIIESVRSTKNGHTMINLEDPSGMIRVLVSKNKREVHSIRLVNDEIIGVVGKYKAGDGRGGPIVFADEIKKVDIPGEHRRRLSPVKGLMAAFTSDIHIGSRMYLEKEWNRMVRWLKGEEDSSLPSKDGSRVKYLVIAGDLVDGIGTYPDQDKDLVIKDIFKQYEALGESLALLPDHIEIVLVPGNHDAVRLAEPQPPLPKEYQECFSNSHIHFLSNPSFFSVHDVHVAAYHGKSIDDLVTLFKDVTYENPIEGMKEMLRFRHLSPTYGMRNQLSPEERDTLIIEDIPDIFVTGHVHRFGLDTYRGVQLIEGSAWQSQTPFQKMMNLKPQPARMGVVELDLPDRMHAWELT